MSFFSKFGTQWYKFSDGSYSLINDITKFAAFKETWINEPRAQLKYKVKDGELPHTISSKVYDTVNYWWTILLLNRIESLEDQWVRTSSELDQYIADKYPFNNGSDPHHYILPNGTVTDIRAVKLDLGLTNDLDAIAAAGLTSVSIYDYELMINENKRNIILVDPDFIDTVATQFEEIMKNG